MEKMTQGFANCTPEILEDRLVDFGAAVCVAVRKMRRDVVGLQIMRQLVRSATSPAANYAEARGAESRRDFIHKLQICLKELRETSVWLKFAARLGRRDDSLSEATDECNQLIAIFVVTVRTAKAPLSVGRGPNQKSLIANHKSQIHFASATRYPPR